MNNNSPASGYKRIAVVGGGIAGLVAALKLHDFAEAGNISVECKVFEAGHRAGGIIESRIIDNCILELGADSFITNKPWGMELIQRLGLQNQIETTNNHWRRTFIARGKTLYPLPNGFRLIAPTDIRAFLTSPLLSYQGRARVLLDLLIPRQQNKADEEETVAAFARRRLGAEALERIVQPMIGGVYVGDVERLSLQATMPWLGKLESEYGSLIRGLRAVATEQNNDTGTLVSPVMSTVAADKQDTDIDSGVRYGMFISLKGGLQKLVDVIIAQLPTGTLRLHSTVRQINLHNASSMHRKYELSMTDGTTELFDAVIMALPAYRASSLVTGLDAVLSQELAQIEYASSVILNLVYKRSQITHPLDGFGFVVPPKEKRSITACTFSSIKFPNRNPADAAVLRVFMGGTFNPRMVELEDQLLLELASRDLESFLGITTKPLLVNVSRYPNAMPQYLIGHSDQVHRIMNHLKGFPGLAVAGNAYCGVGIPDCIHSGQMAAQQIEAYLVETSRKFIPTV